MKILKNHSLKKHNTFRVDIKAKYFAEVESEDELLRLIGMPAYKNVRKIVLGEGANILFLGDFDGLVIKNLIKGVKVVSESSEFVELEIGAGESWHELVMFAIEKGWGGIENMVYIPGTVGAAPVQNIAAYGQNFSDVFCSLDAIELESGDHFTFLKADCEFEYRNSRFKTREMGKFVVTKVRIRLAKNPKVNLSYFEIGKSYAKKVSLVGELKNITNPTIRDVAEAVVRIRKNKLPKVSEIGTAGSVFKNPVVSRAKYEELKKEDQDLQSYPVENLNYEKEATGEYVKIPAGRLLDNLGWKGRRIGNVGTYETQALAVVNYGATPAEILNFIKQMKKVVKDNYGIALEEEILII